MTFTYFTNDLPRIYDFSNAEYNKTEFTKYNILLNNQCQVNIRNYLIEFLLRFRPGKSQNFECSTTK